ncbi:MAG: DUF2460 domain-containing protein [Pseudomonadota bacterium]
MYYLAQGDAALRKSVIKRFDPRYWTVNFPRPMMASVVNTAPDALRIDLSFLRYEDLAGLIWTTEDTLDHPLLRYETNKSYENCQLSFRWRSSGVRGLDVTNGPTLTIEGRDAQGNARSWFVRLWNYAEGTAEDAVITIDFNALEAGFNLPLDAETVYPVDIDRFFLSLVPLAYDGSTTGPLASPVAAWVEISDIRATGSGSVLSIGDTVVPPHPMRAATAYDDQFNQVPERVIGNLEALGYRGVVNHYVGMSHYPNLAWDGTAGLYLPQQGAVPRLNTPTIAWHQALAKAVKLRGMRLILSLSFELFDANCPDDWKQRAHDGSPAQTGWVPPSSLLSPCNTAAMTYLHEVAVAFCDVAQAEGVAFDFQCGEPWWWYQIGGNLAPCFYDDATTAAFTADTGLPVPTKHQSALETPNADQQVYLDWIEAKLGEATLALRDAVRAAHPSAKQMLLFFTPQVLSDAVPLMQHVNAPTAWAYPAYDVFQVEDYDFVTEGKWAQRKSALTEVTNRFGYGPADSHYFAGFVLSADESHLWNEIDRAAQDGLSRGYAEVFLWASPQIQRDGYTTFTLGDTQPMAFHDVVFPLDISFGAVSRPTYATQVVTTASGAEQRNSLWQYPKMEFEVGQGLRSVNDVKALISFFHARKGQAHGFRFRDFFDYRTGVSDDVTALDQAIGTGDGQTSEFPLVKTYDNSGARRITRPVVATVKVAFDGVEQTSGWSVDGATGVLEFDTAPSAGVAITAGFQFDVPVRFQSDSLDVSLARFEAGEIPTVPLIEIPDDRLA